MRRVVQKKKEEEEEEEEEEKNPTSLSYQGVLYSFLFLSCIYPTSPTHPPTYLLRTLSVHSPL